jgi:hypothetical protein
MPSYTLLGARIPATGTAPETPPPPPAATAATAAKWGFKALSSTQRQTIGRLATAAYQSEIASGRIAKPAKGITDAAREWRHAQYHAVTGRNELEHCNQSHYRALRSHFDAMIGTPQASARSYSDSVRTGPVRPGKGPVLDTHEARELWRHKLNEALATYGYQPGYAVAIARAKYKSSLGQCCADELRSLTFAVIGNARRTGRQPIHTSAAATPDKPKSPRLTIIKPNPAPEAEGDPF